jgi:hypothetical protein
MEPATIDASHHSDIERLKSLSAGWGMAFALGAAAVTAALIFLAITSAQMERTIQDKRNEIATLEAHRQELVTAIRRLEAMSERERELLREVSAEAHERIPPSLRRQMQTTIAAGESVSREIQYLLPVVRIFIPHEAKRPLAQSVASAVAQAGFRVVAVHGMGPAQRPDRTEIRYYASGDGREDAVAIADLLRSKFSLANVDVVLAVDPRTPSNQYEIWLGQAAVLKPVVRPKTVPSTTAATEPPAALPTQSATGGESAAPSLATTATVATTTATDTAAPPPADKPPL